MKSILENPSDFNLPVDPGARAACPVYLVRVESTDPSRYYGEVSANQENLSPMHLLQQRKEAVELIAKQIATENSLTVVYIRLPQGTRPENRKRSVNLPDIERARRSEGNVHEGPDPLAVCLVLLNDSLN